MAMTKSVSIETILWEAVEALVSAINMRSYVCDHSVRVARYAVLIAQAIGRQEEELEYIRLGALLHDIGQLYWPEELLRKQGLPLTEEERGIIESHTYKGIELVAQWPLLDYIKPFILYHQEWIDGSGYPYGIQGEELAEEVQIVSLADVYEALRHPRAYKKRPGYSSQEAVEIMSKMSGKRWDARLFDAFATNAVNW